MGHPPLGATVLPWVTHCTPPSAEDLRGLHTRILRAGMGLDLGPTSPLGPNASHCWLCCNSTFCGIRCILLGRMRLECSAYARRPQDTAQWNDRDKLNFTQLVHLPALSKPSDLSRDQLVFPRRGGGGVGNGSKGTNVQL